MARLKYPYLPRPVINQKTGKREEVFTPFVPVMVSINHANPTHPIDALVDSGSDRNLFPLQLGNLLGINFKKIKPKIIYGIGNIKVKAFTSKINIWLDNTKYSSEADFSLEQQVLLLGRRGFFDLFRKVTFSERGRFLYIETF